MMILVICALFYTINIVEREEKLVYVVEREKADMTTTTTTSSSGDISLPSQR